MKHVLPYLRDHLAYVNQLLVAGICPLFPAKSVPFGPGGKDDWLDREANDAIRYNAIDPRRAVEKRAKMRGAENKKAKNWYMTCEYSENK